ncbi:putative nuclear pore complex-interacting protein family member B2 isoform 3-T3 [Dugong dugon]
MFEKDLEEALTQRVNDIDALINCISQLYLLSELKSEGQNPSIKELGNGKLAGDQNRKMQNQKTQMMDVSQAKTAVSAVEEDLKLLQFKLRALMSSKCNLQAYKKELEIDCNLLMVQKAAKEVECQILKMKLKILDEIYEQRKKVSEEKLRLDQHERQESQRQLSALEEQGKLAAEEVRNYKKRIKEMEKQLQQVERSFQHQVALHEVKAHESWVRAHSLERRMIEATRETAYLKHRSRTCAAPLRNSSSGNSFPTEEVEESKVHRAERRPPPPFPGPPFRRCPIRCPPSLLVGYGPPAPPWWSPRPQPEPLPPPPLGQAPGAGSVEAV